MSTSWRRVTQAATVVGLLGGLCLPHGLLTAAHASPTVEMVSGGYYNAAVTIGGQPNDFYQAGSYLRRAWFDGASWSYETIDEPFTSGASYGAYQRSDSRIAATTVNGLPVVFYYKDGTKSLWQAAYDGATWVRTAVDGSDSTQPGARVSDDVGDAPAVTIVNGNPHVFYANNSTYTLRQAWRSAAGEWHFEDIAGNDADTAAGRAIPYGGGGAAAITLKGIPNAFFAGGGGLVHGWWTSQGWRFFYVDGAPSKVPGRWDYSTVGLNPSVAVDGASIHVFSYASFGSLRHAALTSKGWKLETLDGSFSPADGRRVTDLVGKSSATATVNQQLNVWYYDSTRDAIRHAWWTGIHVHFEFLNGNAASAHGELPCCNMGNDISADLDATGAPHLFYSAFTSDVSSTGRPDGYVGHSVQLLDGWHSALLDCAQACQIPPPPSRFVPPMHTSQSTVVLNGRSYDFYSDPKDGTLRIGWADPAWHSVILDGHGSSFEGSSDAIVDSTSAVVVDGEPHVFYGDFHNPIKLRHAWRDPDGGWHFEVLDGAGSQYSGAETDEEDQPNNHVTAVVIAGEPQVFYTDANWRLRHASYDGESWHFENVDVTLASPYYEVPSIAAIAVGDVAHVFYSTRDNRNFKHAWYQDGQWQFELVDGPDANQPGHSIDRAVTPTPSVVDDHGILRVLYTTQHWADEGYPDRPHTLRMASLVGSTLEGSNWIYESVDGPDSSPTGGRNGDDVGLEATAVMLDGALNLFYTDSFFGSELRSLRHAWYDGAKWNFQYLDGDFSNALGSRYANMPSGRLGLLADTSKGVARLAYAENSCYRAPCGLRVATGNGANWQIQSFDD